MLGVTDNKGISTIKLEHVLLGEAKGDSVSGYHCDKDINGDAHAYAEEKFYSKSQRIITANKNQKLFEAIVRSKSTGVIKKGNHGKSTFFNPDWSRQEVVDCIGRVEKDTKTLREYSWKSGKIKKLKVDKLTGIIVLDCEKTTYPILKY